MLSRLAKLRNHDANQAQSPLTLGRNGRIALLIAGSIVCYQIILPPPIGMADNGDFAKIIGRFSLGAEVQNPDDRWYRYMHLRYTFSPVYHWDSGFHSSETLLLRAALVINQVISKDGAFDIRCMGVVHAALFLLAFGLALPLLDGGPLILRILLVALAIFIFCDVMYAAYYNSFAMDSAAYLFLLLTVVYGARALRGDPQHPRDAWFAVIFCLLFLVAKSQHALFGLPLAAFAVWKRKSLWSQRARVFSIAAAGVIVLTAAFGLSQTTPPGYTAVPLFNVIFWGILPESQHPKADLAQLGLDDSYLRHSGMTAYSPQSPMDSPPFAREFQNRTSYERLGLFYARHPRIALHFLRRGLEQGAQQRPYAGTFDLSAGYRPFFASSAFSMWSAAKERCFHEHPWAYLLGFAGIVGYIASRSLASGMALGTMGLTALGIGALCDAIDFTRHLFIFNAIWDISFFSAVCALTFRARWSVSDASSGQRRDRRSVQ